jgi:hypothetical protein
MPDQETMPGGGETATATGSERVLWYGQDSAAVWISDDARSWELVFVDDGSWGFAADVVAGPDGPVAVGWTWRYGDGVLLAAWRSDDGTAWEAVFPPEEQRAPGPAASWEGSMEEVVRTGEWLIATDENYPDDPTFVSGAPPGMWASPDGGVSWIDIPLGFAGFDLRRDRILDLEVLPFGSGGEPKLIVTGFHLTDAAIWVGTLGE